MEARTNASTRNPLSISIVRAIRKKRGRVLVDRIGKVNTHVLSVCSGAAGRRITSVAMKRSRAWYGLLVRRRRQDMPRVKSVSLEWIKDLFVFVRLQYWRRLCCRKSVVLEGVDLFCWI